MKEIEAEIIRLESSDTNYSNCEKLATLYAIRNNSKENEEPVRKSYQYSYSGPVSEFLEAAMQAPVEGVMEIIDEHMEMIRMLYPKEYDMIIDKIREL